MGPEAGAKGGYVIAEGTIPAIKENPVSQIGPFLSGAAETKLRRCAGKEELFANGVIHLSTAPIHTVKPLEVRIPKGRLTVVTGRIRLQARRRWCWRASSPRWMRTSAARRCRSTSAPSMRRASRTSSSSMPRPSGSTSAPRLPPTRAYTTSCEGSTRSLPTQRSAAIRRAIFPTIPAPCAAPDATERALSVWTFNSCRT